MKDKNELTDMLRDADDDTISRIAEEYPQHTKKEADRIYREVEKRIALKKSGEAPDSGSTVSGVDRVKRPVWLRPLAMAASFVLIAGTVAGSIALMKNSKTLKDSESTVVATTQSVPLSTEVYSETETAESNTDAPNELTEEWLLDRVHNTENNFEKCYIECSENGQFQVKAVDHKNVIVYRLSVESDIIDYAYKGKRISIWKNSGNEPSVIENPAENLRLFDYGSWLDDLSLWSITGTVEYIGRKCAVIRYTPRPTGAADEFTGTVIQYIDLETGIILAAFTDNNGTLSAGMETTKFHVNDDATGIPTPQDIKKLIADGDYTVEKGLSLDFLDQPLYDKPNYPVNEYGLTYGGDIPEMNIALEDEPDLIKVVGDRDLVGYCYKTELYDLDNQPHNPEEAVEYMKKRKDQHRVLNVYKCDGKTVIDTFTIGSRSSETTEKPTEAIAQTTAAQSSKLFIMLDSLSYHATSCDGIPEYQLTAPDGTIYLINFNENDVQPGWVWRRPSLIADADNEAPLTQEVVSELRTHWNELDIEKYD